MSAKSGQSDNPQRISVVCDCGKKLVANAKHSGKRLKCPSCGQAVVVPPVRAGVVPTPAEATSAPHPNRRKRRFTRVLLMLMLWSLPVVGVVGAGAYLHFDAKWRQQARAEAANTEVKEAVKGADGWLKQGGAKEGEDVESRLTKAIAANDVSPTANAEANADAVLKQVRTRRAELVADSSFDSAKVKLDAKSIPEAVALLQRYVADPHATKKPEARQLLADCELATSDSAAIKTLVAMSDEQFNQFKSTGKRDDTAKLDRKTTHPMLVEMCATSLRRNLETANKRREERTVVEANRQKSTGPASRALNTSDNTVVWLHKSGNGVPSAMTLHPNGKINDPNGPHSWTLTGRTLELRWADARAPGGFWIDTCTLSDDGTTYRGVNQQGVPTTGWKNPAELIAARLVGVWRWSDSLGATFKFAQDGTYASDGRSGKWKVEKDGTIWLSSTSYELIVVTMRLDDAKISIGYRYPNRHEAYNTNVVASRCTDPAKLKEVERYLEQQVRTVPQPKGDPPVRRQVAKTARTRRLELVADSVFDSATTKLDAKAIPEAVDLLNRYVANPHATKQSEAKQLLADCQLTTSNTAAIKTLVALSDEQFDQFRKSGKLDGRQIAHPTLAEMCAATLRRNLETATKRREENKIAEAKRQQSERLALAAASGANNKSDQPVVWLHQAGNGAFTEMTLHPNGKINDPNGPHKWTLTGKKLELRWAAAQAPGGFWIDTCTISDDGKTYRGTNQQGVPIVGTLRTTEQYIRKQIGDISQLMGRDKERAVDNLKALGPEAKPAIPWLAGEAMNGRDIYVKRRAIEILGEIGEIPGMVALGRTLVKPDNDPETAKTAEDSFLKVLQAIGTGLEADDAIFLLEVHGLGNKRLSPAIESTWAASGLQDAVDKERIRRAVAALAAAKAKADLAKAKEDEAAKRKLEQAIVDGKTQALDLADLVWAAENSSDANVKRMALERLGERGGVQSVTAISRMLRKALDRKTQMAAEDAMLKLLPAAGSALTMDDAIALWEMLHEDAGRLGTANLHLAPAVVSAWEASGIEPVAMADEILRRCRAKYDTSNGQGRHVPPPSPMTWRLLIECDLVSTPVSSVISREPMQPGMSWGKWMLTPPRVEMSKEQVVNMQRKAPWVLWREAHPAEGAKDIERSARDTRESQKNLDTGLKIFEKIQARQAEEERLEMERRAKLPKPTSR